MRKLSRIAIVSNVAIAAFAIAIYAVSTWVNDQNASVVLGQPNFTTNTSGAGLNQMHNPYGVAVDAATGKVFVADINNNRVLRFTSLAAMTNGSTAEASFGGAGATAANTMNQPTDVTVDGSGNLWVADLSNSRVLRFGSAATLGSGSPADRVLGQTLFTTSAAPGLPTDSSMSVPEGVFADSGGRLWVADDGNNRVLRFDSAATLANGAGANGVLGQDDFFNNVINTTQTGMDVPIGVTVDSGGRLWVADALNNRVLRFDNAATLANGAKASGVLGQPDFVTSTAPSPPTASSMNTPSGVSTDSSGRLYVGDLNNNRVLIFNAAAAKANGANADNVLGQPGFTTGTFNNGGLSASSLKSPFHLFFDNTSQNLFVADEANNRILRFAPAVTSAANVTISGRVLSRSGAGIRGATVTVADSRGHKLMALTNAFGYYTFASVPSGDTYIGQATARGSSFAPRVVTVNDAISGLDFSPQ